MLSTLGLLRALTLLVALWATVIAAVVTAVVVLTTLVMLLSRLLWLTLVIALLSLVIAHLCWHLLPLWLWCGVTLLATVALVLLTLALAVETCDAILLAAEGWLFDNLLAIVAKQCLGLLSSTVERQNLLNTRYRERCEVDNGILACRERHSTCQWVYLDEEILAIHSLQRLAETWYGASCIGIHVVLIHKTALQLRALTCQLLRV